MATRIFSAVIGLFYLGLGVCGFVPPLAPLPVAQNAPSGNPNPGIHFHLGYLFGFFPVNYLSSGLMLVVGLVGVVAAARLGTSRAYARGLFLLSTAAMFTGMLPYGVSTVWGLLPLYGWDSGLFLLTMIFAFYFAFVDGPMPKLLTGPVLER